VYYNQEGHQGARRQSVLSRMLTVRKKAQGGKLILEGQLTSDLEIIRSEKRQRKEV